MGVGWRAMLQPRDDIFNQSNDPRIGSGLNGSTSGTLGHLSGASESLESLGSTFIPVLVYSIICASIFVVLRRKFPRVYAPRSVRGIVPDEHLSEPLPSGWFNWIKPFWQLPDAFVLNHCSLDSFLFLRFVKVLFIICAAGCCIAYPILLPINGTGGSGLTQLDLLTLGNVKAPLKFLAHVAVAYLFFGFILFVIVRELLYFISLRQAYLLSPAQSKRPSLRTVLFTCVPARLLDEVRIRKLFGDSVTNVWLPRNVAKLRTLVEEREQTAMRLERAEVILIRSANAARNKQIKSHELSAVRSLRAASGERTETLDAGQEKDTMGDVSVVPRQISGSGSKSVSPLSADPSSTGTDGDGEYTHPYGLDPPPPDVRGSVAAQWIPASDRPYYRPLANLGRRVDTIRWARIRLGQLTKQIEALRRQYQRGMGAPISAVFVEFDTQANAQSAYQTQTHHQPLHMSPCFIGVRPSDVVWPALRMQWWQRFLRRFLVTGFIALAVVFWSIPSAAVGAVSNITFLTDTVPALSCIHKLPAVLFGLVQGLLPAAALSSLMAIVPLMLRACARAAGIASHANAELFTQNAYFAFQVIQVFIVTTLTSALSASITQLLRDPFSAKDLLSESLPKASNFYLSYILVQSLAGGAWQLAHVLELFQQQVLRKSVKIPRAQYRFWTRLRAVHWGSIFPVFTNMGVIAISYSCIAPLILVFAGAGMCVTYMVYKYNLVYALDSEIDTQGLVYPRALMQLMAGLYLAEVCLIGVFSLHSAYLSVVLMILFLVFTALVHMAINDAVHPLLRNLPQTLARRDKDLARRLKISDPRGNRTAWYFTGDIYWGPEDDLAEVDDRAAHIPNPDVPSNARTKGLDGSHGLCKSINDWLKSLTKKKLDHEANKLELPSLLTRFTHRLSPPHNNKPANFFVRFLQPYVYEDFQTLARMMEAPAPSQAPTHNEDEVRYMHVRQAEAYYPPEIWQRAPHLWIPKDDARVSRQEVAHTRGVIAISDRGAWLDEKGRVHVDFSESPLREPRVVF